jgi:hypothetical protein
MMNKLQQFIRDNPYLTDKTLPELVKLERLAQVLVRCGGCRFVCAAQDVGHIVAALENAGDYVRDVSWPVGSADKYSSWQPENMPESIKRIYVARATPQPRRNPREDFNEAACGGTWDGFTVGSDADSGL